MPETSTQKISLSGIIVAVIVLGALAYGGYRFWLLDQAAKLLTSQNATLEQSLGQAQIQLASTTNALIGQEAINNSFAGQISSISSTVGQLDKLSKTDPQLLEKYSKVYFLNENYMPASLTRIDSQYVFDKTTTQQILTPVWPHLQSLLQAAANANVPLEIISSYRSFGTQAALKTSYKVTYGTGANAFSADQGYSEHQLGTAVDFTTPALGAKFDSFVKADAYRWLSSNAYRYGFILSYPPDNAYYEFEPWHWRFVGVALATTLHNRGEDFYDMDQREINTYLVNIFD